jgi:hypothetical protein
MLLMPGGYVTTCVTWPAASVPVGYSARRGGLADSGGLRHVTREARD